MSTYPRPDALVSTGWLAANLHRSDVKVMDATYHLPTVKRDARAEYVAGHIPGATFFDIDRISDRKNPLPHMIPSATDFAEAVGMLGIRNSDTVVVYDAYGLGSAGRAWWMFRLFGHDRVAVLDGGLPKWKRENRPLQPGPVVPQHENFVPKFRPELVRAKDNLLANLKSHAEQVLDARPAGRFTGKDAEPRPGLRGGHIPQSLNLPANTILDPQTMTVLPEDRLRAKFAEAGIDLTKPVVTTCGSGVSACTLALGLHLLGADKVAIYDGSWSEWGLPGDTPVESK